jgi:flagellar basal-body rod modification protein FlgD
MTNHTWVRRKKQGEQDSEEAHMRPRGTEPRQGRNRAEEDMAAAGTFSHAITAGQEPAHKSADPIGNSTSGAGNAGNSGSSPATISANDFLTLLVTEMQNQDPTASTDPNEYINQLVQVNSLEQLIGINQTLTTDLGAPAASANNVPAAGGIVSGQPFSASSPATLAAGHPGASAGSPQAAASTAGPSRLAFTPAPSLTKGNLSIPSVARTSERVAHALDGDHLPAKPVIGRFSGFERGSLNNRP